MNAQNSVQWTPGGSELLFVHHDQLYQATADGTRVQGTFAVPYEAHIESRSYLKVYLTHADVSPDGTRVAYSVCWDSFTFWDSPPREPPDEESRAVHVPIGTEFYEIAVWDATTDEVDYLAVGSVPVWSPDGARIAFLSDYNYADPPDDRRTRVEADPGLFSMAADGSDIQRLAPADHGDVGLPPRWSPDGQRLAFVRGVGSAEQAVYTVGADGSNPRQISAAASLPSWSPDGARLALALPDGEEVALYTIAADGSDPRRLTTIEGWQSQGWNEGSVCGRSVGCLDRDRGLVAGWIEDPLYVRMGEGLRGRSRMGIPLECRPRTWGATRTFLVARRVANRDWHTALKSTGIRGVCPRFFTRCCPTDPTCRSLWSWASGLWPRAPETRTLQRDARPATPDT